MTTTDTTRPTPGPGPDSGHTGTHDAQEGLRGRIAPETIAELRGLMDTATGEMVVSASLEATYSLMRMSTRALFVGLIEAAPALLDAAERLAEVTAERDALRGHLFDAGYREAEMRAEADALAASVARVRAALDSHPDPTCDEYASKGPISCGWKSALIDVRWALADGSGS